MRPLMPDFMERVTTVIGDTVYLPCPPEQLHPDGLASTLAHELVHQLDQADWGPWFYVSYAVLPLPVGRTLRADWERRAYAVDLMLAWEIGGEERLRRVLDRIHGLFWGPAYGWMWAGRRAAWAYLAPLADEVRAGSLQVRDPYADILAAWRGEASPTARGVEE
jgi:hypothetical protein